jgi:hypothetical protein
MSLPWIRKHYGVPAKRGGIVRYKVNNDWQTGKILSAKNTLKVDLEDGGIVWIHPTDPNLIYEAMDE